MLVLSSCAVPSTPGQIACLVDRGFDQMHHADATSSSNGLFIGTMQLSSKKQACSACTTSFSRAPGMTRLIFTLDAPWLIISTRTPRADITWNTTAITLL